MLIDLEQPLDDDKWIMLMRIKTYKDTMRRLDTTTRTATETELPSSLAWLLQESLRRGNVSHM